MVGRAAYHNASMLVEVDRPDLRRAHPDASLDREALCRAMMEHAARHIANGGRLVHVTRHMVGLFQGVPGARRFRQVLSRDAARRDAGPEVIAAAFAELQSQDARASLAA